MGPPTSPGPLNVSHLPVHQKYFWKQATSTYFTELAYFKADFKMTKELRFNKQKFTDRRANNYEKIRNFNVYPSGPPRIALTSRAPRRPPLPPLASYATGLNDVLVQFGEAQPIVGLKGDILVRPGALGLL